MDQSYIAGLADGAARVAVGKTWLLDRASVMLDLRIGVEGFEAMQLNLESRMPGKWDRQVSSDGRLLIYKRLD